MSNKKVENMRMKSYMFLWQILFSIRAIRSNRNQTRPTYFPTKICIIPVLTHNSYPALKKKKKKKSNQIRANRHWCTGVLSMVLRRKLSRCCKYQTWKRDYQMRLLNKAVSLIFPMAPAIQAYIKLLTVPRAMWVKLYST